MSDPSDWARTWIGGSTRDEITVAGRDLPTEIMGRLTLTELSYLLITRREPTPQQCRLLDAVLVSLADHGLTPSALAARLTYTGAPEAIQGAVAAGLLGAGSVFLGPAGDTAQFLYDALRDGDAPADPDDAALRAIAERAVDARRAAGERVPGLGHPVHKDVDPRTPRLYAIAHEEGLRDIVCSASRIGVPIPCFMATLSYLDGYRSDWLPANLIQAQRDFFGAHTYSRIDRKGTFHTEWNKR